jgi:hypothetical protein
MADVARERLAASDLAGEMEFRNIGLRCGGARCRRRLILERHNRRRTQTDSQDERTREREIDGPMSHVRVDSISRDRRSKDLSYIEKRKSEDETTRLTGNALPKMFAGHGMPCPYERKPPGERRARRDSVESRRSKQRPYDELQEKTPRRVTRGLFQFRVSNP